MGINKEMIVKRMMDHGKGIKISDLCYILKCDTHNIRDILHDDPCFVQDTKSFLWSYLPSKDTDKTITKLMNEVTKKPETKTMKKETLMKKETPETIETI